MSSEFFLMFLFRVVWRNSCSWTLSFHFLKNTLCWESKSYLVLSIFLSRVWQVSVNYWHFSQSCLTCSSESHTLCWHIDWFIKPKKISLICLMVTTLGSWNSAAFQENSLDSNVGYLYLDLSSFWSKFFSKFKNFGPIKSSKASELFVSTSFLL